LPPTGHLDDATLTELNVSASARLMSIALSVSRASNLPHDADQDYVLVNIAGYKAEYRRGDETLWSGRTMVGKLSTRSTRTRSIGKRYTQAVTATSTSARTRATTTRWAR